VREVSEGWVEGFARGEFSFLSNHQLLLFLAH
jgi:hypothetical protein